MPTLNRYVDRSGHYIQARPSNLGNITYQLTPSAEKFITELGYSDGDNVPWGLINPLKTAGEVYTHGTGIETQDESAPELSPANLPELSRDEAEELIKHLENSSDIDPETVGRIRKKLDGSNGSQHNSDIERKIGNHIEPPDVGGNEWDIAYDDHDETSGYKSIRFTTHDEDRNKIRHVYYFEPDNKKKSKYRLNEIIITGEIYYNHIELALSHKAIILRCLNQLSSELESKDIALTDRGGKLNVRDIITWPAE